MNVLHVIPGDLWAGAEAQVYYIIRGIYESPLIDLTVIVFNRGELYNRIKELGIDVIIIDEQKSGNVSICLRIKQYLIQRNVSIAHVHEYKGHMLTALARLLARKKQCAVIRTLHGQNIPCGFKSHLVLGCQDFFLKYMTDHIIAVSAQLKEKLLRQLPKAKVHCIYNAVDHEMFFSNSDGPTAREAFSIGDEQFWIGTAARLEKVKNIPMLIEAAKIFKNKHPELNFRVSIFGNGSLRDDLQLKIDQYGLSDQVALEGHSDNILPVLKAFDVFTLTSHHEGLPMSLLEAMSVGTIPVCAAVGGMQEVITHGEDGFLVTPGNPDELAEIFTQIYREGEELIHIRLKVQEKIKLNFSVANYCKKLIHLYETAIIK